MADQTTSRKRSIWPFALGAMFCVHASIVFITMTFATKTPANAEPEYYEKAVAWNEESEARLTAQREGWSHAVTNNARSVTLTLDDSSGQPITGATAEALTFHRADAMERIGVSFTETAPGRYTATLPSDRAGLWDLRLSIRTADGKHALITETIELLP